MDRIKLLRQPSGSTSIVLEDEDLPDIQEEVKEVNINKRGGRREGAGRHKKIILDEDDDSSIDHKNQKHTYTTQQSKSKGSRKRITE